VFEDHRDANAARPDLFALIRQTPFLHWQILTKRPENLETMLPDDWGEHGWPNVWLGTSIEDMRVAHRAKTLRRIPATVRFISYEPALGPLDELDLFGIDWIIYGGESGPEYRRHDLAWPRAMRVKCAASKRVYANGGTMLGMWRGKPVEHRYYGTEFFFKQSSAPRTEMGITLDGETIRNYPTPLSLSDPESFGLRKGGAVELAYLRRRDLDLGGQPGAPFYEEDPRATARAALPLLEVDR
ncbi:MAG TPA: DUF5131 family protein, partial [Gemmatimonadaceae bacterium]